MVESFQILNIFKFYFQRKKQNSASQNRQKRQCTQPDRYGQCENQLDHNNFFENLEKKNTTSDSPAPVVIDEMPSENDTTQIIPNDFFKIIKMRMDDFKEHLIRIEAKLNHLSKSEPPQCDTAVGTIDMVKLQKFGIPTNSKTELDALEKNLRDENYRQELVSILFGTFSVYLNTILNVKIFIYSNLQCGILQTIGGSAGKSNGTKVLEPLVHALIAPNFLSNISWTGRGKGKEKKIALNAYVKLLNLITVTLNKADKSYNQLKTENDLKYKIIKYATAKYGDSNHVVDGRCSASSFSR